MLDLYVFFYLNFKIIIKRSGLIAHSLSIAVGNSRDLLITELNWFGARGRMTSLHNSVRTPTTLNCSIPCIVPSLHYFSYFTAVPSVQADFAAIVVLCCNYFWIKSTWPAAENVQTERAWHNKLLCFFFLLLLSFLLLLNKDCRWVYLFLPSKSSSH